VTREDAKSAFEQAEDQPTLEGLAERAQSNPGAPFEPEIVLLLRDLRKSDRAAFENVLAQLGALGFGLSSSKGSSMMIQTRLAGASQRKSIF
jgi:hypothetical protein